MESKFMISEVFRTSWKFTKSQIWVLAGLFIGFTILSLILNLLSMPAQSSTVGSIITTLISIAISSICALGYTKNMFQTLDGEEPQFSAYGQQSRKTITYIIANIIYALLVTIGLVLLIIPGIYLGIRLQFFTAFIVEEDCGIIESLQKSWKLTEGQAMPLFLLALTMMGIGIIGFILFIIGIFIAFPLVNMMQCYVFRKLNRVPSSATPIEE